MYPAKKTTTLFSQSFGEGAQPMPRTKTTILGTDRLGEERVVKTTEDAEQDGEDEGLSCINLTRRTAPPMA
eukprot:scaffold23864_cov23-Phaeocystis_antarctica.AAC.1